MQGHLWGHMHSGAGADRAAGLQRLQPALPGAEQCAKVFTVSLRPRAPHGFCQVQSSGRAAAKAEGKSVPCHGSYVKGRLPTGVHKQRKMHTLALMQDPHALTSSSILYGRDSVA